MSDQYFTPDLVTSRALPRPRLGAALARRALASRLAKLCDGSLTVIEGGVRTRFGGPGELHATVTVRDPAFWERAALRGHIGAAESYLDGDWSVGAPGELTSLVRLLLRNRAVLDGLDGGLARLAAPVFRAWHALRRNSRSGSRRNIAAHYDLGNDFYALFLDPTLSYSSALFERGDEDLESAQRAKIDRLCRKLALGPDDHLLEIGTGWGALAIHAAETYGCRVTTTTLSQEQARLARERVREAGLEDLVEVLEEDYRDLRGRFTKLVSVEMIEAVGHEHLETFFRTCSDRLAPDGLCAIQGITIDERQYERAKRSVDFIQRYVFPGGALPAVSAITSAVARASDLSLVHLEDLTASYARTLRLWSDAFDARRDAVSALGFDARFLRLWEFYLGYCEGGFAERAIGCAQMLFAKPRSRHAPVLGRVD